MILAQQQSLKQQLDKLEKGKKENRNAEVTTDNWKIMFNLDYAVNWGRCFAAFRHLFANRANVFCFLSSLSLLPLATTAVFGSYLSSLLLANTVSRGVDLMPIHMIGEVSWELKEDDRGPLSINSSMFVAVVVFGRCDFVLLSCLLLCTYETLNDENTRV
jgi:hypothetical protein